MTKLEQKVLEFIERGKDIGKREYHPAEKGFHISYVSGPLFEAWMNEINILNDRYLKNHPLYSEIRSTALHHSNKPTCYEHMMGYLEALANDSEYW